MITRALEPHLVSRLGLGKVVVLLGARQVGKTTLLRSVIGNADTCLWLNADETRVRQMFEDVSAPSFAPYLAGYDTVVIDEAQRISDIGVKLKVLHEAFGQTIQVIATGSSSFDLANKINEPLTGRKWQLDLFPLSAKEMIADHGLFTEEGLLETRLVFGWYPEVVSRPDLARDMLTELAGSTLYKDIFVLRDVRRPEPFEKLVRALAYQIGSRVNLTELASLVGIDKKTVGSYIGLLEQAHIVFRVGSYSQNLRNELTTSSKIYFYDTGVRNAVIGDFSPVSTRADIGHLFENFVMSEVRKIHCDIGKPEPTWFWRTTDRQEIDLIRLVGHNVAAYEIKWNPKARATFPASFRAAYPEATMTVINRDNVLKVLSGLAG